MATRKKPYTPRRKPTPPPVPPADTSEAAAEQLWQPLLNEEGKSILNKDGTPKVVFDLWQNNPSASASTIFAVLIPHAPEHRIEDIVYRTFKRLMPPPHTQTMYHGIRIAPQGLFYETLSRLNQYAAKLDQKTPGMADELRTGLQEKCEKYFDNFKDDLKIENEKILLKQKSPDATEAERDAKIRVIGPELILAIRNALDKIKPQPAPPPETKPETKPETPPVTVANAAPAPATALSEAPAPVVQQKPSAAGTESATPSARIATLGKTFVAVARLLRKKETWVTPIDTKAIWAAAKQIASREGGEIGVWLKSHRNWSRASSQRETEKRRSTHMKRGGPR